MRLRVVLPVLLMVTLGVAAAGWQWGGWRERQSQRQTDFDHRRLAFLETENSRLRGMLDTQQHAAEAAATAQQRMQIEQSVTELRALPFLQRINYREIPRTQLPEILRQKLAQQVPDREFGAAAVALADMGLLPHGFDLKSKYLALMGEQIGAFYDQHSQELFTFRGQSLANAQNRVILAHELTHALEDQHFHLARLPLETHGNDDRALAASALVEGDATLVMNRYMTDNLSAAVIKDSLASALTTDVRQLAAAPRYLRETLLFPYLHGLEFCQSLYARGGWDTLAAAFRRPPGSTSEILHPDRYSATPPWSPVTIAFSNVVVLDQNPLEDNVLGEFGTRQLLSAWLKDDAVAARAANAWSGDRYLVYGDNTASSYVWWTRWDDQAGATNFSDAMQRCLSIRYNHQLSPSAASPEGVFTLVAASGRTILLRRVSPTQVVLIDAQDARWTTALQAFCSAEEKHP